MFNHRINIKYFYILEMETILLFNNIFLQSRNGNYFINSIIYFYNLEVENILLIQ